MDSATPPPTSPLHAALASRLNDADAHDVSTALRHADVVGHVEALLAELRACSEKLAGQTVDALPDVVRRCGPETVVGWMDVAVALAARSGAVTIKYLRESPRLLGALDDHTLRHAVIATTLELADDDSEYAATCAFEWFRKAPELLRVDAAADLPAWAEIGRELTAWNQVLGIEFLRECPKVAEALALDEVRPWVAFGMKLLTTNSLGNPDYIGILEFFRASPGLLCAVPDADLRPAVVRVGSTLADRSPAVALTFLAEAPALLAMLPSTDTRRTALQYGGLLAERDADAMMAYARRAPEVILAGHGPDGRSDAFDAWFRGGMAVLEYSAEGARAYFALETAHALRSIEQSMHGVPLRHVSRSLQLLAHMICGHPVRIASLPDAAQHNARLEMTTDGPIVSLPAIMNRFPSKAQNTRGYTVALARAVGRVAFGTYRVNLPFLRDLARRVVERYGGGDVDGGAIGHAAHPAVGHLTDFFALYPQQGVIRDLWVMLEDARVDFLLRREYAGLRDDLAEVSRAAMTTRSFLHGMTAREMTLDALLVSLTEGADAPKIPDALQPVVTRCREQARTLLHSRATHEDAVALADTIYQTLDAMIGNLDAAIRASADAATADEIEEPGAGPRASEDAAGGYRAVTNWVYQGILDPDAVRGETGASDDDTGAADEPSPNFAAAPTLPPTSRADESRAADRDTGDGDAGDRTNVDRAAADRNATTRAADHAAPASAILDDADHASGVGAGDGPWAVSAGHAPASVYPEWDGGLQDYRLHWCRVIERTGVLGDPDFARRVLDEHAPAMRILRRYFEAIRPAALRRIYGCDDGDDVDMDAAIRAVAERRAGLTPSDRVYARRDTRDRHVAVAFLVDVSGSTSRQLDDRRRVIDVEKESLVLLAEALDAIGDDYALYGFSGQGRRHVEVTVLKAFGDTRREQTVRRIAAIEPCRQNRDGAAIRHVTRALLRCPARHRLLVLLSDGRPLDSEYGEEYALQDTRMALREARQRGVTPCCLTIDRAAAGYLSRMYGDARYSVLHDVRALPERLPRLYQRLTRPS